MPGQGSPVLHITGFAPSGSTFDARPAMRVQFDQPVVEVDQLGKPLQVVPASLEPRVPLTAHWSDRQTLELVPDAPLTTSTRYRLALAPELAKRVQGSPPELTFVHRPLALNAVTNIRPRYVGLHDKLVLVFNQPVQVVAAEQRCWLRPQKGTGPAVALMSETPFTTSNVVALRPRQALAPSTPYELSCVGLTGVGGNAGLATPHAQLLTSIGPSVASQGWARGELAPDQLELELHFSTPMDVERVRASLKVEPALPGIEDGWLSDDDTTYRVRVEATPRTRYKVSIDPQLADAFGQSLTGTTSFSLLTGDARARFVTPEGITVIERKGDGMELWTRNMDELELACAALDPGAAIRTLSGSLWQDDPLIDWKARGLTPVRQRVVPGGARNTWVRTVIDLRKQCGATGLVLAEVSGLTGGSADRSTTARRVLASVTDLGVVLKEAGGGGVVWVTHLSDGKPVPGARVELRDATGKLRFTGTADAQGLVRTPGTQKLSALPAPAADPEAEDDFDGPGSSQEIFAFVSAAGDQAVASSAWSDGLSSWNWGVDSDWQRQAVRLRGFVESDRGLYRPGELVHVKGLLREIPPGGAPRLPRATSASVVVSDARGQKLSSSTVKLSRFGGFTYDLQLSGEAPVGDYRVTVQVGDQTFSEGFQVEEVRPATFELGFAPAGGKDRLVGDRLGFEVSASYLFGAPVVKGAVTWTVERQDHWLSFPGLEDFAFSDYAGTSRPWWDRERGGSRFVGDGETTTDATGVARFELKDADAAGVGGPVDYVAHVTVRDDTDQTISKDVALTAHATDRYLGLDPASWVMEAGKPMAVEVALVDTHGKPLSGKAQLTLVATRWSCEWTGGPFGRRVCTDKSEEVSKQDVIISAGRATVKVVAPRPGDYAIRVSGQDGHGKALAASTSAWAVGKGHADWLDEGDLAMQLIADAREYKPGDRARLVTRGAPAGAMALVTVERDGVIDAWVRPATEGGEALELPVAPGYAPNVFASVVMVRGRSGAGEAGRPRLKMGVVALPVDASRHRLQVKVELDRAQVKPGQPVAGTVTVTDASGRPVVAEVAVSAADEGMLQLIAYRTPDPMSDFYRPWGLGVFTSASLTMLAHSLNPDGSNGDEGGDAAGKDGPAMRSRFVSSAYWNPALITSGDGKARFEFKAPDNLTAFRVMAVAAGEGDGFGSSDTRLTVKKPLVAEPVLPRFFGAGDQVELGAVIRNYTGKPGTASVHLAIDGVALDDHDATIAVADGASARVRFTGRVGDGKLARVELVASLGDEKDGVRMEVPVVRPVITDRSTVAHGQVVSSASMPLAWNGADVIADESLLAINLDRTGLGELEGSLEYLIDYPYGCLEQTMSRTIPMVSIKSLSNQLALDKLKGPDLDRFVRAGLDKVVRHQHPDGHFSLWPDSEPEPFLTVYAMWGLGEARRAGLKVDEAAVALGKKALQEWVNERKPTPDGTGATLAQAAYVLATLGSPDRALNARLFDARHGLPRYGQAFLLMAMHLGKDRPADEQQLLRELAALVTYEDGVALLPEPDTTSDGLAHFMSSDVRTSAIYLTALLMVAPTDASIDALAEGLRQSLGANDRYESTQEAIYSLAALARVSERVAAGSATVTVKLDGKVLVPPRTLKGAEVARVKVPLTGLAPGALTIETSSKIRYGVALIAARRTDPRKPLDSGIAVSRQYLDPKSGKPVSTVTPGQVIEVVLELDSKKDRDYVALEDPLPAGVEVMNPRLVTSGTDEAVGESDDDDRWWSVWTWTELRSDRALAFADRMPSGQHTLRYLVRATLPGTFTAAPPHAEEMYHPGIGGRGVSMQLTVKP